MSNKKKGVLGSLIIVVVCFFGIRAYLRQSPSEKSPSELINNQFEIMKEKGIPEFDGSTPDGTKFHLSKGSSKNITIVNYWASWCGPCVEEFPSLVKMIRHFDGKVKLVAISLDSEKKDMFDFLNIYSAGKEPNLTLLWDPENKLAEQFGTYKLPESYVVTPDLKLIKKVAGSIDWMRPDVLEFIQSQIPK